MIRKFKFLQLFRETCKKIKRYKIKTRPVSQDLEKIPISGFRTEDATK